MDVETLEPEQEVKLLEPPLGTLGKYVALSYCWGDESALQATKSNLSELLQGVDEDELPATIWDAVELTRYIGVQYLWVDALCIIQDDTQDWVRESARMSAVYAQAFLTISASSVASSRASFLHQSRGNKEVLFHWQSPETATRVLDADDAADTSPARGGMLPVRRTTRSGFHQDPNDEIIDPTMTRAWTLQEHALSTRLVCFSTDEIQWTCRTLRACECGNPEEHQSPGLEQLQRGLHLARVWRNTFDLFQFWTVIVEAYCRRDLTCTQDKLPALSGLAHEFFKAYNDAKLENLVELPPLQYLAGLWNFELPMTLLWSSSHRPSEDNQFVDYRAPSWSWASVEGRVHVGMSPKFARIESQVEILAAVCTPANSSDPFGQVVREGTFLRLRAIVLETKLWLRRQALGRQVEEMTPYGRVFADGDLEEVLVGWGGSSAAAATASASAAVDGGKTVTSDPVQIRTLQRLRRRSQRSLYAAARKDIKRALSVSESENGSTAQESDISSGSDEESDSATSGRHVWKRTELGRQFTVWLLHVADYDYGGKHQTTHPLVLGRPAGDEQVYERLGHLHVRHKNKWAEDIAGQAKSTVTII